MENTLYRTGVFAASSCALVIQLFKRSQQGKQIRLLIHKLSIFKVTGTTLKGQTKVKFIMCDSPHENGKVSL